MCALLVWSASVKSQSDRCLRETSSQVFFSRYRQPQETYPGRTVPHSARLSKHNQQVREPPALHVSRSSYQQKFRASLLRSPPTNLRRNCEAATPCCRIESEHDKGRRRTKTKDDGRGRTAMNDDARRRTYDGRRVTTRTEEDGRSMMMTHDDDDDGSYIYILYYTMIS